MPRDELVLHVGSGYFTPGLSQVLTFRLDGDGEARLLQTVDVEPYPTFLAVSADRRTLYLNVESETDRAAAVAFRRSPGDGCLTRLSAVRSGERQSAYIAPIGGGFVAQANYQGHSVAVLGTGPDGDLGPVTCVVTLPDGAATHSVARHPGDDRVFVANRSTHTIDTFHLDARTGALHATGVPCDAAERGPRHLVVSPDGQHLFCSDEQSSTVSVYRIDGGAITWCASHRTVPDGWVGENRPADLELHPSGRALYVTNRQHRSVAVFDVDGGELAMTATVPVGDGARNLSVDPAGRLLAVGNLRDDSVSCLALDPDRGRPTGHRTDLPVPAPCGILLAAAPVD
ncbi:lactonase family protein [Amycolatopsis sp. cmx-4-68]|uniref:lactonase family protein n=1 Tax=Amycolatopsis sp. cmx-4-68 TaxID=2790938 RepID=UPI003979DF37